MSPDPLDELTERLTRNAVLSESIASLNGDPRFIALSKELMKFAHGETEAMMMSSEDLSPHKMGIVKGFVRACRRLASMPENAARQAGIDRKELQGLQGEGDMIHDPRILGGDPDIDTLTKEGIQL